MNLIKKYQKMPAQVRASLWFLCCSFLQKGISVITTPIFARLMDTAEYGQYNVFNSWASIISVIVSFQLSYGVFTQGLVKFDTERKQYASSLQTLSLVLCVGWTCIYLLFREYWNSLFGLTTVQMLLMLVTIWATAVFNFWAAEQRVLLRYRELVALTVAVSIAKPVIGIIFVCNADDKVTARILGIALVELVGFTALFFKQMIRGRLYVSKRFWKHAILFNAPLIPHYLSQTVLNSSDRIMISKMVNEQSAGIYSIAYSVAQLMTLFSTAISQTMGPWVYQKIKEKQVDAIKNVAYGVLCLFAVLNILLIAFAPEMVAIFAPPSYYEAIWVIPPVVMSTFFMFAYDLFAKFGFYYEKTHYVTLATLFGAVLNVVLNYIFIGLFGYVAAGYTTLVCYIVFAVAHYCFMTKICNKFLDGVRPYSLKVLLGIAIVFMMLGGLLTVTYNYIVIRYSVIIAIVLACVIARKKIAAVVESILKMKQK